MDKSLDLNKKSFRALENSSGRSSSDTVFTYEQNDNLIVGTYIGGDIKFGNIVGSVIGKQTIELLFQCITVNGELLSGKSQGKIHRGINGKLEISFDWCWLTGAEGSGISHHVEI